MLRWWSVLMLLCAEREQKEMDCCYASCVKLCMLRERYGGKERLVAVYRANYVVQCTEYAVLC